MATTNIQTLKELRATKKVARRRESRDWSEVQMVPRTTLVRLNKNCWRSLPHVSLWQGNCRIYISKRALYPVSIPSEIEGFPVSMATQQPPAQRWKYLPMPAVGGGLREGWSLFPCRWRLNWSLSCCGYHTDASTRKRSLRIVNLSISTCPRW